jgi:hypothetical protein
MDFRIHSEQNMRQTVTIVKNRDTDYSYTFIESQCAFNYIFPETFFGFYESVKINS